MFGISDMDNTPVDTPKVIPPTPADTLMDKDSNGVAVSVNVTKTFDEYENLISVSKSIMNEAYYLLKSNSSDLEVFKTANDLIKTVAGLLKQFSKVTESELEHKRKIEMESVKLDNKIKLMEYTEKMSLKKGSISVQAVGPKSTDDSDMPKRTETKSNMSPCDFVDLLHQD